MFWLFIVVGGLVDLGMIGGFSYIASNLGPSTPPQYPPEHYNRLQ